MTRYNIFAPDQNILAYYCNKHGLKRQDVRRVTSMEHLFGADRVIILSGDERGFFDYSRDLRRLEMEIYDWFRGEIEIHNINTPPESKL